MDVSTRLTDSPAALVQGAYGMSPQMQKYYRAQSVMNEDDPAMEQQFNQAILELNPTHPIVISLKQQVESAPDDVETMELGKLVYDVAAVAGGYDIEDPSAFSLRMIKLMTKQAGLSDDVVGDDSLARRDMEDPAAVTPEIVE